MNESKKIYQLNLDAQQLTMVINALSLAAATKSNDLPNIVKAMVCFVGGYDNDKYNALMRDFYEMCKVDDHFSKNTTTNIKL